MASYQNSSAYDLSMFEPARKRKPANEPAPLRPVKKHVPVPVTPEEADAKRKATRFKVIEVVVALMLFAAFIAPNIFSRIQVNELNGKIATLTTQLNEVKSENTRLDMELKAKISLDNVQNYAENVLGMVKRDRYQVYYFNIDNGNEILPAQ